jgi:hypothetical protein
MRRTEPAHIDAVLAEMSREEIANAFWYVELFQRWGSMSRTEADEWHRRVAAWSDFLDLEAPGTRAC